MKRSIPPCESCSDRRLRGIGLTDIRDREGCKLDTSEKISLRSLVECLYDEKEGKNAVIWSPLVFSILFSFSFFEIKIGRNETHLDNQRRRGNIRMIHKIITLFLDFSNCSSRAVMKGYL